MNREIKKLIQLYRAHRFRKFTAKLRSRDPRLWISESERKLLSEYARLAKRVPAYRKLLGSRLEEVNGALPIDRFRKIVPIIDKTIFDRFPLEEFISEDLRDEVELFFTSSGSTGTFSFNAGLRNAQHKTATFAEYYLDYLFHIYHRKTLLVNCLPMSITIPTLSLPAIQCGTRDDAICYLVRRLAGNYEQILFVGEQLILKRVFEKLQKESTILRDRVIGVITGAEYIPESYREYMGQMAGFDFERPENGMLYCQMGASELSNSILVEDASTMKLRRALVRNHNLLRELAPVSQSAAIPLVMQYMPSSHYLEISEKNELIISNLDNEAGVQLIRYNTHDLASLRSWADLAGDLDKGGLGPLKPERKLPVCFLWGKTFAGPVDPNLVKTCLYQIPEAAARVTGNFFISDKGKPVTVSFQLKDNETVDTAHRVKLEEQLRLGSPPNLDLALEWVPFNLFHHHMVLDFQTKIKYLAP